MCMPSSDWRHLSILLTGITQESKLTYVTQNCGSQADDSTHGTSSLYANSQTEVPACVCFLDIHFRRCHDLLKRCEKGRLRSVTLVNYLCAKRVADRGNYSCQTSIRDATVMNPLWNPAVTFTTRLT